MKNTKDSSCSQCDTSEKSEITRRTALNSIASGGALGALAITSLPMSASAASSPLMMSVQNWRAHVGSQFRVMGQAFEDVPTGIGSGASLTLEKVVENVHDDPDRPAQLRRNSISLMFTSDREVPCATLALQHRQLGRTDLFVHEVQRDEFAGKRTYEVVLN